MINFERYTCLIYYIFYKPADTTGLQSVAAVIELNGSITVTCTFATGTSSTGCLVTILNEDSLNILFTVNITRHNGDSEVGTLMCKYTDLLYHNYFRRLLGTLS